MCAVVGVMGGAGLEQIGVVRTAPPLVDRSRGLRGALASPGPNERIMVFSDRLHALAGRLI
jgi:hypothetical protein